MSLYNQLQAELIRNPKTWLVTGVAGFIGSHLLETLLQLNQRVVGLDNFATGHQRNLDEVKNIVTSDQWINFHFMKGDIHNLDDCHKAMFWFDSHGTQTLFPVQCVLHQAALGSVPRSLVDPISTNLTNITGFLNMLIAARDAQVESFTYAASSSTYGDHPALPKVEENIGKPLSPYAVTKLVNELYAEVFAQSYGFKTIGLRYFNVFGPRQDPNGAYAAVIPKWTSAMLSGIPIDINGDGESSRDFCYVANVVQANLLAASTQNPDALNQVYNVAVGDRTTLNQLFALLRDVVAREGIHSPTPNYRSFRDGDVLHSQADISKAQRLLGFKPSHTLSQGIANTVSFYERNKPKNTIHGYISSPPK